MIASEHWCSSAFANTDLDLQLKKHGIHKLIVTALIAHTFVEATVRYAVELGYEVTMVKDATASYSDEHMRAALEINIPNYASAILTADEIVTLISARADAEIGARPLPRISLTILSTEQLSRRRSSICQVIPRGNRGSASKWRARLLQVR